MTPDQITIVGCCGYLLIAAVVAGAAGRWVSANYELWKDMHINPPGIAVGFVWAIAIPLGAALLLGMRIYEWLHPGPETYAPPPDKCK